MSSAVIVMIVAATLGQSQASATVDPFDTAVTEETTYANEASIEQLMADNPTVSTVDADGTVWYDVPGESKVIGNRVGPVTPGPTDPNPPNLRTTDGETEAGTESETEALMENGNVSSSQDSSSQAAAAAIPSGYSYYVSCTAQMDHPHLSKGANGAVAKTRITCKGYGKATVSVKVGGLMSFRAAPTRYAVPGKTVTRAQSNQTQVVTVNGGYKTYYLPQPSTTSVPKSGGRGTGFWLTTSVWQITPNGTPASKTITIWKTI